MHIEQDTLFGDFQVQALTVLQALHVHSGPPMSDSLRGACATPGVRSASHTPPEKAGPAGPNAHTQARRLRPIIGEGGVNTQALAGPAARPASDKPEGAAGNRPGVGNRSAGPPATVAHQLEIAAGPPGPPH